MNKTYRWMAALFVLFIGAFSLALLFLSDKPFSQRERRYLQQTPEFTWERLASGKFTSEFEAYVQDQFPLRDALIDVKGLGEELLLKKENNGLYFGQDGYLLDGLEEPGEKFSSNLEQIRAFSEKFSGQVYLLAIPNSAGVYLEKLPAYAPHVNQAALLQEIYQGAGAGRQVTSVPLLDALMAQKEQPLYYKLDHHYTVWGAYYAYGELAKALGFTPLAPEDFTVQEISDDFFGTYYAKAGRPFSQPDAMWMMEPKEGYDYTLTIRDTGEVRDSLYSPEYLEQADKYSFYLDGNHASVTVHSSIGNGKKLLVLKDSYAQCLIPFLANHYETIEVVDLRYFRKNIAEYAQKKDIEDIVLIYGVSSFLEESGFSVLGMQ